MLVSLSMPLSETATTSDRSVYSVEPKASLRLSVCRCDKAEERRRKRTR